ncbi:MAG: GTPase HflX [Candidatus Aminicenantes bacterium]|nr:GTPase HflX [Candidatus Aminicenantes bacterium]
MRAVEKTVLVSLSTSAREKIEAGDSMDELEGLSRAAGAVVLEKVFQVRPRPSPRYFIGEGKVEELKALREKVEAETFIFDHRLSPTQQRNLEAALEVKVIDRTQLILDIFARRARSTEGKLQVELAQLKDLLPRLAGRGKSLSRLGGGIGTRGPGEKKLETDRRHIQDRITKIQREVRAVAKRRSGQRLSRKESLIPMVALVGYTSVGKSTLFNRLAEESTPTSPSLFATLDPLVRRARFADGLPYFLSDTVGFIRKLPVELVVSFRATLEEVLEADQVVHVIDLSAPSADAQAEAVAKILADIGAADIPVLRAYNKIDRLPDRGALLARNAAAEEAVYLSAAAGDGVDDLKDRLRSRLYRGLRAFDLRLPKAVPGLAASLGHRALILKKQEDGDYHVLRVMADPGQMVDLAPFITRGE